MVNVFSENNTMKLEINYMKKTGRNTNIGTLNNMLLNNQQVNKKIRIYLETNENGNTPLKSMLLYSVLRCIQIFATPRSVSCQAPLSSTVSWSLLKFMFIELVMLSNHLILCYTLLLLPSIFSSTRVFPSELAFCIRWPKY